jgi:CHAT domain-containing protein
LHGRKLYDWLIAPIRPYLQSGRVLVFEPDATFSEISIPALVDENGHYFGESFPIAYSLGFGYLENLRHAGYLRKSARAFVVGPPALGWGNSGEWESLPDAAEEAAIVAAKFSSAALITGRKATPKNVQGGFAGAEVFHFAGHAGEKAEEVGLLLAHTEENSAKPEAAYLGARQIASVDLKDLRLAVLAACSTAKGNEKGMADPDSLVHAFVRARVPSVVASRWQVDSKSTSNFMKTFYTGLLAKNTTARAVQSAQLELKSKPGSEHPYYWASFSLFGRE